MIHAAALKARELFRETTGEFFWYFQDMRLTRREGSLLFIHAGVDDVVATQLARDGVDALNERFRQLIDENLFELYHGPVISPSTLTRPCLISSSASRREQNPVSLMCLFSLIDASQTSPRPSSPSSTFDQPSAPI